MLQFAPNAGVSLSSGGGTMVALQQAEILAGDLHHEVWVAGYHSFALAELERMHGVALQSNRVQLVTTPSKKLFRAAKDSPVKLSPYDLLFSRRFGRWIRETITNLDPEVVWFHDDIPKAALPVIRGRRVHLYVHFPLGARTLRLTPGLAGSRGLTERVNDGLLVALQDLLLARPDEANVSELWVNSNVTSRAVHDLWGVPSRIVYPYVRKPARAFSITRKRPMICAVGSFTRSKGFNTLVKAFALADLKDWTFEIVGHSRERGYLRELKREVLRLGLQSRVRLRTDVRPGDLENLMDECSIICNGAMFEPLGLSLVEGMTHGAVPVIVQSPSSGGWMDVCRQGELGFGFRSVSELAELFRSLSRADLGPLADKAFRRSQEFSRAELKGQLERVLA